MPVLLTRPNKSSAVADSPAQQNKERGMGAVIVSALYVAAQMLADVGSLRIVTLLGMSMDGGTLVYPLTFTLRDMVHKVAGVRAARALIWVAAVVNVFMAALFWLIGRLPADATVGPQTEFVAVLSPVWRIIFASILAEVLAELADTEAYRWWVTRVTTRYQWARVLLSNAVAIPLDSLLFCWVAFGGTMPASVVWSILLANIVVKGVMTLVGLPLIYVVKERA
jgi:hypothetical protein